MNESHVDEDATHSGTLQAKVGASLVIFCISLFAVSFPSLSKKFKYIRIPTLAFFLGKHFGTGVILSTAFVHLLADAFKSLKSEWTGLIVLVSLLAIFLVEYVSTAYVDHLHSYPSEPPTPAASITPSNSRPESLSSPRTPQENSDHLLQYGGNKQVPSSEQRVEEQVNSESSPLTSSPSSFTQTYGTHDSIPAGNDESEAVVAFPQHSCQNISEEDGPTFALRATSSRDGTGRESSCREAEIVSASKLSKDDSIFGGGHHRHEAREAHAAHTARSKKIAAVVLLKDPEEVIQAPDRSEEQHQHSHHLYRHHHHIGHGHVHLDMESWGSEREGDEEEGLLHHDHDDHAHHVGHREQIMIGRRRQIVGILMLQIGIMLHSLVIGLTLAITTGPEFTTLVTALLFHQLFEGLSLGIRIAGLPTDAAHGLSTKRVHLLKPTLATTFALTTPLGIGIGLFAFSGGVRHDVNPDAMLRMQGVMSAMSAGMLIYAACVEMLAGDFVMDPLMWRSGFKRQFMALASLAAGVCAMAFVGMFD